MLLTESSRSVHHELISLIGVDCCRCVGGCAMRTVRYQREEQWIVLSLLLLLVMAFVLFYVVCRGGWSLVLEGRWMIFRQ